MTQNSRLQQFLAFSAEVTAFSVFDLQGTGQAESYFSTVGDAVGEGLVAELLAAYAGVRDEAQQDESAVDNLLRKEIFSNERLGPIARNIIKLWYVGIWYELPREWTEAFGAMEKNFTFMVSATAYTEGLLWPAIGANPSGAKAPGYGSWAAPPRIPAGGTDL